MMECNSRRPLANLLVNCTVAACILLMPGQLSAVPPDHTDDALRKMCEKGLAQSASAYCRMQLTQCIEKPVLRARWAMRQMECQCQTALQERDDPESAWASVAKSEMEYRQEFSDDPRLPWLAWQLARADLLRSQQALAKWLATPAAQRQRDVALQAVRRVQEQIDLVEKDIKARLPLAEPRSGAPRTQAPSTELLELSVDCTLLRCESLLVRSKCYPAGSRDRVAAAADVHRVASEMLQRAPQDWPSRDELLVAQASSGLDIGRKPESLRALVKILNEQPVEGATVGDGNTRQVMLPSPRARIRAGTVAIESFCSSKELSAAESALNVLTSNFSGPEVDLCSMRLALARIDSLPVDQRAGQLTAIVNQAKQLGDSYGGYWRNRGEALLVGSTSTAQATEGGGSQTGNQGLAQELLTVEVRQLLSGGQVAAAISKLKLAVDNARATGQHAQAIAFAMQAAALLQRDDQWLAAADLLVPTAIAGAEIETAPAAHALAAWCLAQSLKDKSSDVPSLASKSKAMELEQRYERTLQEQLLQWPAAKETQKVEEYLSNWLVSKKRYEDLVEMWAGLAERVDEPERKSRALKQWLEVLLAKLPLSKVAEHQTRLASRIREGKLSSCERTATIAALAGSMLSSPLSQTEAEALTGLKMPAHWAESNSSDQALLAALLTLAAARRGDVESCRSAMQFLELDQLTATIYLTWIKSFVLALDEMSERQIVAWRDVVAKLPAWPDTIAAELSPSMKMVRLRLDQIGSNQREAIVAAQKEIEKWAEQHKNDPQIQMSLAASIEQLDNNKFNEAVRILKQVATHTSKESETYLRARWIEIRWRLGRGETQEAKQIAALTLSSRSDKPISPAWWKARFEAVAK